MFKTKCFLIVNRNTRVVSRNTRGSSRNTRYYRNTRVSYEMFGIIVCFVNKSNGFVQNIGFQSHECVVLIAELIFHFKIAHQDDVWAHQLSTQDSCILKLNKKNCTMYVWYNKATRDQCAKKPFMAWN